MTKKEIIEKIADKKLVEEIIKNICGGTDIDLQDLAQDIYIDLLNKKEEKIKELYNNNQMNFFITRIVFNNVFSTTSRYYSIYKKNKNNKISLDDLDYDKY